MTDRPRLLDLFCCGGGAGTGYYRAGFDVVGVDIRPQPAYPFDFNQGDALEYLIDHGQEFDVVHASPPCQGYAWGTRKGREGKWPVDLIPQVREVCDYYALPLILENVPRAEAQYRHPELALCLHLNPDDCGDDCPSVPVQRPITLCGAMFGLKVLRHRVFEVGEMVSPPPHPKHRGSVRAGDWVTVAGHGGDNAPGNYSVGSWQRAMGIDWLWTHRELAEAIPPAFTQYIGERVLAWL